MDIIKDAVMYFLGFKPYVMLPVIIFVLAIVFRIKLSIAIKSSFQIGIGFIGIFMVFDFFVKIINPAVQAIILRFGLTMNVLDTGWVPLTVITWSFSLAPVLVAILIGINVIMLIFKLTKTVNIDIWNFWHVILASAIVYYGTNNAFLSISAAVISYIFVLKLAEWSAPMVNKYSGMNGICIPHLSAITYLPLGIIGNKLLDMIPFINKLDANPETMKKKLGLAGEPMILGFVMGVLLGIFGGYSVKETSELSFGFAAVIFILPKMCEILGSALIPISEGMKEFISKYLPNIGTPFIGLDVAVLFGLPSVIVTSLLLIPISLILSLVLPGVLFIPLGDLTNLVVPVAILCVATNGNIIRAFILGIPMVIANLYIASNFAPMITEMAAKANYKIANYDGLFTSFLDGGNPCRAWLFSVFKGDLIGLLFIPVVAGAIFFTWKLLKAKGK